VLLVLAPLASLSLAGQEHGRTIPLPELHRRRGATVGNELKGCSGLLLEEHASHRSRRRLSGFAFNHAIKSFKSFAGMLFFATMNQELLANPSRSSNRQPPRSGRCSISSHRTIWSAARSRSGHRQPPTAEAGSTDLSNRRLLIEPPYEHRLGPVRSKIPVLNRCGPTRRAARPLCPSKPTQPFLCY
jgi:hypothetical protein